MPSHTCGVAAALVSVILASCTAEDPCTNDDSAIQSMYGADVVCADVRSGLSSELDCTALGSRCAVSCGLCHEQSASQCTSDEIRVNKQTLLTGLHDLGVCIQCEALAAPMEEMVYVTKDTMSGDTTAESVAAAGLSGGYSTLDTRDPCLLPGVTCDRCGAVRDIIFGRPSPVHITGFISGAVFALHKLSVLYIWSASEVVAEGASVVSGESWKNLTRLTLLSVHGVLRGAMPSIYEAHDRLSLVHMGAGDLSGNVNALFGSPSLVSLTVSSAMAPLQPARLDISLCELEQLTLLQLPPRVLFGDLPTCLTRLKKLQYVAIGHQAMRGPVGLFMHSPDLQHLDLRNVTVTGTLPVALSSLLSLRTLLLDDNDIEGTLPDLLQLSNLEVLQLQHNLLVDAMGTLGGYNLRANLSDNLLRALPQGWSTLRSVWSLDLSRNLITEWPPAGVWPRGTLSVEGILTTCGVPPLSPFFEWPSLNSLSIASNPMTGFDVRTVLTTLSTLPELEFVDISNCGLAMDLPLTGNLLLPYVDVQACSITVYATFLSLVTLLAAGNAIERIDGPPWLVLQQADFSNNNLSFVHSEWLHSSLAMLNLHANPELQAPVSKAALAGVCGKGQPNTLAANPGAYSPALSPFPNRSECTSLCVAGTLVQVDSALNDTALCRCREGWYGQGTDCSIAEADSWAAAGYAQPTPCPPNSSTLGLRGQVGQSACKCDAGFYASYVLENGEQRLQCKECPLNSIRTLPGALSVLECELCDAGRAADFGHRQCSLCSIGSVAAGGAGSGCRECDAGQFAKSQGQTACEGCPLGQFQNDTGASACVPCGGGVSVTTWTRYPDDLGLHTQMASAPSEENCGCAPGLKYVDGECKVCGVAELEGLICPGGPGVHDMVLLEPGYYSDGPEVSVFRCWGDEARCPGYRPPGDACANGRFGLMCALCEDGKAPSTLGSCRTCSIGATMVFPLVLSAFTTAAVAVYVVMAWQFHTPMSTTGFALVGTSLLSVAITSAQQIGIMAQIAQEWFAPMNVGMDIMSLLTLDTEILNIGCLVTPKPLPVFTLRLLLMLTGVLVVGFLHIVSVALFFDCEFRRRQALLVSAVGAVTFAFFIAAVVTVTGPLQCQSHPNSRQTSRLYPSVECWESSTHHVMLVVSALSVLVPLAFLAGVCWVVYEHPKRVNAADTAFLESFRFLIVRFKPSAFWFAIAITVRGLLLSMTMIIPNSFSAIFVAKVILLCNFALLALCQPWRVVAANYLDIALTMLTIIMVSLASHEPEAARESKCSISQVYGVVLCSIFALMLTGLFSRFLWVTCCGKRKYRYFLSHYKAQAGAFARLLKTLLAEGRSPKYAYLDCDDLGTLQDYFTIVSKDTQTLLVLNSGGTLLRPWCAGQITSAHANKIEVLPIRLPDYQPLTKETLREYAKIVDIAVLTEAGISLSSLQTSLTWYEALPGLGFPAHSHLSKNLVMELVSTITSMNSVNLKSSVLVEPQMSFNYTTEVTYSTILVDHSQPEVVASALVLERFITSILLTESSASAWRPWTVERSTRMVPEETQSVICMFSAGCLDSHPFVALLGCAAERHLQSTPVLGQETFRVPSKETMDVIQDQHQASSELSNYVTYMFKTIAKLFNASYASKNELTLVSEVVATRLRRMANARDRMSSSLFSSEASSRSYVSRRSRRSRVSVNSYHSAISRTSRVSSIEPHAVSEPSRNTESDESQNETDMETKTTTGSPSSPATEEEESISC